MRQPARPARHMQRQVVNGGLVMNRASARCSRVGPAWFVAVLQFKLTSRRSDRLRSGMLLSPLFHHGVFGLRDQTARHEPFPGS